MSFTEFYRGYEIDNVGRNIDNILKMSDAALEVTHDWVQWVFPLQIRSNFNEDAPLPTNEELAICKADPTIQENFDRACHRFLAFLGLKETENVVVLADNFEERRRLIWGAFNHNYLRVTRFLESMRLMGRETRSAAVYECLMELAAKKRIVISAVTEIYWHKTQHAGVQ